MFVRHSDFDDHSREGASCSACGSTKMPHHSGIARGEMIDHEGFYDVCEGCVLQLGGEFGMLPADEALQARKGTSEAFETIQKLEHELNEQRQSFDHITQQYANLTMEHKAALSIAEEASKSQSADRALIAELNRDNNLLRKQLPDSDV